MAAIVWTIAFWILNQMDFGYATWYVMPNHSCPGTRLHAQATMHSLG